MTEPNDRVSASDAQAAMNDPVNQLLLILTEGDEGLLVDPKRIQKTLEWISSRPADDPDYKDPLKWRIDLLHLGFINSNDQLKRPQAQKARVFLQTRWRDPADNIALWRHLRDREPTIEPPDYTEYTARLSTLLDAKTPLSEISTAVVAMSDEGVMVPDQVLYANERLQVVFKNTPERRHAEILGTIPMDEINWFPFGAVAQTLRRLLKDKQYGLNLQDLEDFLDAHDQSSIIRQLKGFFGNASKTQTLRDLGILDENGEWSEVGFQRQQALITEAYQANREPSLEWLRWQLHRRHRPEEPIPFAWALQNDMLIDAVLYRARRLASIALSGGMLGNKVTVSETITPAQYDHLRQLGTWLHNPLDYERQTGLWYLGFIASQKNINWDDWTQVCSFVWDKIDQPGDFKLVKDWMDGVITFEAEGRYQSHQATPFKGAKKIGRNDPCPCGSRKKSKKCCRR